MKVDAFAMCLVVQPFALVDVAVCVDQSASAIRLVVVPVPFVQGVVFPDLLAAAFFEPVGELAEVAGAAFEGDWAL